MVAGYSISNDEDVSGNHGESDYWIVKLDSSGDIKWQKCFGGTDSEYAFAIQETSGEAYVVTGISYSNDVDVSGIHGEFEITTLTMIVTAILMNSE